jgi:hypothetical protein
VKWWTLHFQYPRQQTWQHISEATRSIHLRFILWFNLLF